MQATSDLVLSQPAPRVATRQATALSPIEQVFSRARACPMTFAFTFEARLDVAVMRASLAATLRSFPLLSCRLVDKGALGIALRSDPALGALRVSSLSMASGVHAEAVVDGRVGGDTARFTLAPHGAGSKLIVSISHAVADGFAFMQFMYGWARAARGLPLPPVTRHAVEEGHVDGLVSPEQVRADCGAFWLQGHERAEQVAVRAVRRQFGFAELARERHAARTLRGLRFSDNDLICAHLWREFAPQGTSHDADTFLTCPVDARPFCAELGRTHFGCAVVFATAALSRPELERSHPADVAARVHSSVSAVDEQRARASMRTLAALRAQHGDRALDELHPTHPSRGLLVTNLTRLPLSGLDFGTGAPADFEPIVQSPRCALLFSIADGIEARVYLPA